MSEIIEWDNHFFFYQQNLNKKDILFYFYYISTKIYKLGALLFNNQF